MIRWSYACVFLLWVTCVSAQNRLEETKRPRNVFANFAKMAKGEVEHQKAFSLNYGISYDPNSNHDFALASFQWLYDYDKVMLHPAPASLYLKLEAAAGMRIRTEFRGIISCGFFAHYYLDNFKTDTFRPYVDAGTGIIFTDFQNPEQGLRINFNPRFSLGTEIHTSGDSKPWFIALRAYHISNAGLHKDNRGINAAMILVGRHF